MGKKVTTGYRKNATYKDWITDDGVVLIGGWCRQGLTNEDIAHNIGIHVSTLYDWKNKYTEISDALKSGKEVADFRVENALYKNAIGFEYEETKVIREKDDNGKDRQRVEKTTKKSTPNTTAQIYWMKNRMYDHWRDRREVESSVTVEDKLGEFMDLLGDEIDEA